MQSQGAFTFLSTWREISQRFSVSAQKWVMFAGCGLWVGDPVTRACPKPPHTCWRPQQSFSTSSPIAPSTPWLLAEVCQASPAQCSCLLGEVQTWLFPAPASHPEASPLSQLSHVHLSDFPLSTGAAIAGVYRAAGKKMIPFEALIFGVGQTFCVVVISFLRILATL